MKICRFVDSDGRPTYGCDREGGTAEVLRGDLLQGFARTGSRATVRKLLAPVDPRAILCIGLNYKAHAAETGAALPAHPILFMKNPAALANPGDPIRLHPSCLNPMQVDYEAELAVVIGTAARNVIAAEALRHVAGYTAANDVSARDWQKNGGGGQWVRGKSFDTFCPLGPELVTPDEIPDPQALRLGCRLNGQVMQDGTTADMIFPVARLIEILSGGMTLLPGTVILTGTPAGVGIARKPPVFMKPGDVVEISVQGIGTLLNPVEAG